MMSRPSWLLVATLAFPGVPVAAQAPSDEPSTRTVREPDPDWIPRAGDTAEIHTGVDRPAIAATNILWYPEMIKLAKVGDKQGFEQLENRGQVIRLENGTPVLILDVHADALLAGEPALEVRVKEGKHQGAKGYVHPIAVARMVTRTIRVETAAEREQKARRAKEEAERKKRVEKANAKERDEKRAKSLLNLGRAFEKIDRPKAAIQYYRKIVKDYPESGAVTEAKERIKAIENRNKD